MKRAVVLVLLCARLTPGQESRKDKVVPSFEMVWSTLRDRYWDPKMAGLNWQQVHDTYLPKVQAAKSTDEARDLMSEMIHKLPSSHLALIPAEAYGESSGEGSGASSGVHRRGEGITGLTITQIDRKVVVQRSDNAAVHPGWIVKSVDGESIERLRKATANLGPGVTPRIVESWLSGRPGTSAEIVFLKGDGSEAKVAVPRHLPAGKLVQFSNLPPMRVVAEHRTLPSGVGYIYLNVFLDPVSVMPEFEQAVDDLRETPGIVLDLRGNPGGLGIMAMGIAGWFVSDEGEVLGTLKGRAGNQEFVINPRVEPYTGKLAILVDEDSASTSEILAQGLKDLGRARIFGARTEGAALLSDFIELPDADRFQYPEANYVSFKGRVLEGNGVEPDVVVKPTIVALLAGHDPALDAAEAWSLAK